MVLTRSFLMTSSSGLFGSNAQPLGKRLVQYFGLLVCLQACAPRPDMVDETGKNAPAQEDVDSAASDVEYESPRRGRRR